MAKKDFKQDNPANMFISEKKVKKVGALTFHNKLEAPEGYKTNPLYIEKKSRRVQLMLRPSQVERAKEMAFKKKISMNELFSQAVEEYLQNEWDLEE